MRFLYCVRDAVDFSWARVLSSPSSSLVVVDQFDIKSIFSFKTENDAPVCPHRYRPETAQPALERMQAIPWEVESLRRRRLIEAA